MNSRASVFTAILALSLTASAVVTEAGANAASPDCDQWIFTASLDLPQGYWSEGEHSYGVRVIFADGSVFTRTHALAVTEDHPLHAGEVTLRIPGIFYGQQLVGIHPDQDTALQVFFNTTPEDSREAVRASRDATTIQFSIDGGDWITTTNGPVVKLCSWLNPGRFHRDYQPDLAE